MGLWREGYFRFRRITDCLWPDPYRAAYYDRKALRKDSASAELRSRSKSAAWLESLI
jgi:hypothetical protein